jgi:hypothetical protein
MLAGPAHRRTFSFDLLEALNAMLAVKGGNWADVRRNASSGGLLQEWHAFLSFNWSAPLAEMQRRERSSIAWEVARSRFGVVYLLGQTNYAYD